MAICGQQTKTIRWTEDESERHSNWRYIKDITSWLVKTIRNWLCGIVWSHPPPPPSSWMSRPEKMMVWTVDTWAISVMVVYSTRWRFGIVNSLIAVIDGQAKINAMDGWCPKMEFKRYLVINAKEVGLWEIFDHWRKMCVVWWSIGDMSKWSLKKKMSEDDRYQKRRRRWNVISKALL